MSTYEEFARVAHETLGRLTRVEHSPEDVTALYQRIEELIGERDQARSALLTLRRRMPKARCPHCRRRIEGV